MNDLMFLFDDNSSFNDYSNEAKDYLRDDFDISFIAVEDAMYIGLYKPFNSFYSEIKTVAIGADISFTINGNNIDVSDDTKNFTRSGFMQFAKPGDWSLETINGVEAYWLKITSSTDFDISLTGVNIVFSDDNDLRQEARQIDRLLAKGDASFIAYQVAARNEIIQTLRNGGNNKKVDDLIENITKWDILDMGEIRQASKYLTLSKIFFDNSENIEDKMYSKFKDYEGMFGKAFNLFYLRLDKDDDGKYQEADDIILNSCEIQLV